MREAAKRRPIAGIGRNLNLPYDGAGVDAIVASIPWDKPRIATEAAAGIAFPVELPDRSAEALPFEDGSIPSLVCAGIGFR